jgi:predicted nucleotidyltransferase
MGPDLEPRLRERLLLEQDVLVAYLFGSQARGEARPGSDVDVAVLLPKDADFGRRHLELIAAVADAVGLDAADVVVLNEAPVPLGYRVLRDGLLLFSRDDRARVDHYVRTVDRYLDMAPMRRTIAVGLRHRIAEGRFGRP